jgi:hypothetical protein
VAEWLAQAAVEMRQVWNLLVWEVSLPIAEVTLLVVEVSFDGVLCLADGEASVLGARV